MLVVKGCRYGEEIVEEGEGESGEQDHGDGGIHLPVEQYSTQDWREEEEEEEEGSRI